MDTSIIRPMPNLSFRTRPPGGKRTVRGLMGFLIFAAVLLFGPRLEAQSVIAPAGRTLFYRSSLVRSFVEIDRFSLDANGTSVEGTQYVTPLAVVYGFHRNWEVIGIQPYVLADITTRGGAGVQHTSLNGLADAQFFLQYDGLFSRNSPGGLTRLSGVFGVQAPTGAERFSTGAFEYTGGLIFEKAARLRYYFTGDFEYTFATRNDGGVSTGNSAQFDAVPAYLLIARDPPAQGAGWARRAYQRIFRNGMFLILEFNGGWHGNATRRGADLPDTGGTTLRISPGIQYFPSRSFLVEFSAPLPAVTELNGIQPHLKTAFLVGFRYLF